MRERERVIDLIKLYQYVFGYAKVKVGMISTIEKGIQFNKSNMSKEGLYPVINGGIEASGYIDKYNQEENTITISQGGASAGYVNWQVQKFWAGAHCYIVKSSENIINKYLYYYVKSKEQNLMECQYGAGIPALSKSTIENLIISLPTIAKQKEIVQTLDNFDKMTTDLTEGLPAEIDARRKQYEYYRDKLLTFKELEN